MSEVGNSEDWKRIIKIHGLTKSLLLKAEELDYDHDFFWGPVIQQRDALDHIIRALYPVYYPEEAQEKQRDSAKYIDTQLDKALGHIYRGFFDVTDWLSIIYRENIADMMESYCKQDVRMWFPAYLTSIEPEITKITLDIADIRDTKDVGRDGELIKQVEEYINKIDRLEVLYKEVIEGRQKIEDELVKIAKIEKVKG